MTILMTTIVWSEVQLPIQTWKTRLLGSGHNVAPGTLEVVVVAEGGLVYVRTRRQPSELAVPVGLTVPHMGMTVPDMGT